MSHAKHSLFVTVTRAWQVRGLQCELHPGDALLLPAYWFAHRQLEEEACVTLELLLQPLPSKLPNPDGLVVALSRMAEAWFSTEAGTANVRRWLMVREHHTVAPQLPCRLAHVQEAWRVHCTA